jgi:type IV pilus assembly protein PilM
LARFKYNDNMFSLDQGKKNFEKIFPLPKFLEIPAAGIDVSDGSVKFIEIERQGKAYSVTHFGEKKLADGVVINGEIKDRNSLISALKEIKKEHGISYANVSLPEEKAFLFKVNVPTTDHKGIMTNLSFQIEQKVPVSLAEAVFDYDLLFSKNKNRSYESVVTVFPVDFVQSYLDVFRSADIHPILLEIEAQAIASAVIPRNDMGTFLVVDFGHKRSGISVISKGAVVYTSTLEVGGDTINEKLLQTGMIGEDEIIRVKNEIGFSDPTNKNIYEAVSGTILALKDEVNKHLVYWNGRADETGEDVIEKIFLCGGNSNIAGVREHLSNAWGIPVQKGNVWENLFSFEEYIPPIDNNKASSYATAIGLAFESIK